MANQKEVISNANNRYKMILVGDTAVGKSSIVMTMKGIRINPANPPASTIGASFTTLHFEKNVINCWDTAGQERYFSLVDIYFKDADIVFFVYDTTRPETLESIFKRWYPRYLECRIKYGQNHDPCLLFLIGNKGDTNEQRNLALKDPIFRRQEQYINLNKMHHFIVSALTQDNLDLLRDELNKLIQPESSIAQYKYNKTIKSLTSDQAPSNLKESIQGYIRLNNSCCYN
jgi:small GTP-binding protein